MTSRINITDDNSGGKFSRYARPFSVYVDGEMLRDKRGVGRRFANRDGALEAGIKARDASDARKED